MLLNFKLHYLSLRNDTVALYIPEAALRSSQVSYIHPAPEKNVQISPNSSF